MVTEFPIIAYIHAVCEGVGFAFEIYQITVVTAVLTPLAQ